MDIKDFSTRAAYLRYYFDLAAKASNPGLRGFRESLESVERVLRNAFDKKQ